MQYYLFLFLAIVGELIGTTCLKLSDEFTNLIYSGICLLSYVACFYFLSLALNGINLNIAYATWSALGIVAATLLSVFLFNEGITLMGVIGTVIVIIGIVILNLYGTAH